MRKGQSKKEKQIEKLHKRFLYVGGFELPDRNAAAHRVIGIAKAIKKLGHEVFFLNYTSVASKASWKTYFGFECYDKPKQGLAKQVTDISDAIMVIQEKQIDCVIMYNYPAFAMSRLLKWCKKASIKCYADATEWYVAEGKSPYALIKRWDSETRMKKLHFKTDGVIAISEYLYQYYKYKVHTVKIPPIVDIQDDKWRGETKKNLDCIVFVYAGSPSAQKECLDKIVDAIETKDAPAWLQIIGITKEQYETMYKTKYTGTKTEFLGRVDHMSVVALVKQANWSIIIRENNQVVKAGFPTKLVESISCGTPVIVNRFSNVEDYLTTDNSIICDMDSIDDAINQACEKQIVVDKDIFDYRQYIGQLQTFLK